MVHKSVEVNFFLCFEANRPSIQGSNSLFDLFVFFSSWFLLVCVFELNFISWSTTTRAAAVGEGHTASVRARRRIHSAECLSLF